MDPDCSTIIAVRVESPVIGDAERIEGIREYRLWLLTIVDPRSLVANSCFDVGSRSGIQEGKFNTICKKLRSKGWVGIICRK